MAGLRVEQDINAQSENFGQQTRQLRAKEAAGGEASKQMVTRRRLGEIGNNANQGLLGPRKENLGVGGITKPPRLTKQTGTVSLKGTATNNTNTFRPFKENISMQINRPKRKHSGEKVHDEQPMEVVLEAQPMEQDVSMDVDEAAYSTSALLRPKIENIDVEDHDDPQLVVDYVNEIYGYMRYLENKQSIRQGYLSSFKGVTILPKMRSVLVDWLVEVHQQFSLLQETLFLAVAILDRYMQDAADKVPRKKLQLVGVTSMFIAAKYEEMYAPEIGDFVYITDNAYSQSEIRGMEQQIMAVLEFDLGRPLPLHFLRRNSKAGQVDATVHTLAKYVMELTLVEYNFAHIPPSKIAASALAVSLTLLERDAKKTIRDLWTPTIEFYAHYSLESIKEDVVSLASLVLSTSKSNQSAKLMAVRKKYANKKFAKISELPELIGPVIAKLADGDF